jgi:hypothetical protein
MELIPRMEVEAAIGALESQDKAEFYTRLAQWLVADPVNRSVPPF